MKLQKALAFYEIDGLGDGLSQSTLTVYVNSLMKLVVFLGDPEIESITERDVRDFFGFLRTQYEPKYTDHPGRLSSASMHRYWKAVRSFFKWAKRDLKLDPPDTEIKMPAWENKEIDPYNQRDVQKLLVALETSNMVYRSNAKPYSWTLPERLRNRSIILTLLDTGLRPSELCRLRMDDLHLEQGRVFVKPFQPGKTLSGWAYIEKRTQAAIKGYLETRGILSASDYLFTTSKSSPMRQSTLRSLFQNLGIKAKVPHCNAYRFRHTFAIEYLRNGGDVFSLQILMRHKSMSTTRKYVKFMQTDLEKIHRKASPTENWSL
jgi:integrase/recombinase XerD